MKDDLGIMEISQQDRFSFAQWTRSSGRVVRKKVEQLRQKEDKEEPTQPVHVEVAKIYRKFLALQDKENKEFSDAVSYGLQLLDAEQNLAAGRDSVKLPSQKLVKKEVG